MADATPQERELVYCHQCENEWYRDEHGIVCPECQSDFTEVIEADHDPRAEEEDDFAPDPDEDDIDQFHWQRNGPGEAPGGHLHGTIRRNITLNPGQQPQAGGGGLLGGLMGMVAPMLRNALDPSQQQQQAHQGGHNTAPGSPEQGGQPRGSGTFVRAGSGPGFSYTITTSSTGGLYPRDANHPQPMQNQPAEFAGIMAQMMANIGAMGGPGFGGGPRHGGPVFMGAGGGPMGLDDVLGMFGMPPGGQHGDAVYSQQALDRVITQLMEQHQAGNAPPPASAEAIDSLPKRQITAEDLGENGQADCSICMDTAEIGSEVTVLPCSHWFHFDCVKAWLVEHDTCPHCRQGIMPKDDTSASRPRDPSQAPHHDMHSPQYQRGTSQYPFPSPGRGDGSQSNPFTVPESPEQQRSSAPPPSSGGMFSRMREAFSPSGVTPRGDNGGSNTNPNPHPDTQ
ncbi:hypothetical protein TI39_contig458g00002 [Zymoseptoria brevis]|uniref:RING-type E3 ubiquitin transferase n=1 Tax=Zymoseptoria brevis TaxID=1047168 RepID=A0A0F4GK91_9PEZI|nr:hypothetical protein TI39_contig458g00002 [Zymoseptoria brevis]